jgi:sugar phosphate isomerase/epimerase
MTTHFSTITIFLITAFLSSSFIPPPEGLFSRDNLVAWCVVPFDAKKRNPAERAVMLKELGFTKMAYDWRNEHLHEFDEELAQLNKNGIEMTAFWWNGGLPFSQEDFNTPDRQIQIDFLNRNVDMDIWVILDDRKIQDQTDEEKFNDLARRADLLASVLTGSKSRLLLYNHGGWGGYPDNLIEVIKRVKSDRVGIVYNFHHGHEHLELMPDAFYRMLPYLQQVNLNGMNPEGPKILSIGEGSEDVKLMRMIKDSGYKGPIGIIGHIYEEDVEQVLKRNLSGLKKILHELGDTLSLSTY